MRLSCGRWLALVPAVVFAVVVGATEPEPIVGERNLFSGYPALNDDGTVNVVIENPAGSVEKWEVNPRDGVLRWEMGTTGHKTVSFLAYPANYGMVPRTQFARTLGGDAEPLDVLVLGAALPRGTVTRARLIGVLALLEGPEQDDKLLAVVEGTPFADLTGLAELRERFPGAAELLETWFTNYKGPGAVRSAGFLGAGPAMRLVRAASKAFERAAGTAANGATAAAPK